MKKSFTLAMVAFAFSCRAFADDLPPEVFATFGVDGETFHAWIADPQGVDQAISLWQGTSNATIPNGLLIFAPVVWNQPWSWYLAPQSIEFAQLTVEECDGAPSYVESSGSGFGPRYCPWSATMLNLRGQNGVTIDRDPAGDPPGSPVPEPPTFTLILVSLCWYAARARGALQR